MKIVSQIVKSFRQSIFAEYLPMFFILGAIFAVVFVMIDKREIQEKTTSILSCEKLSLPGVRVTEEPKNYGNDLETYIDDTIGFSFKYPPHLEVFSIITHTVLSYREDENDDHGKIVVSIGLNDENMTAEEWLLSYNSGYLQSKDQYGDCYKTLIGGQEAVSTDGGMWVVVNTPDGRYRLSIADLTTGKAHPLFAEMDVVTNSLKFLSN